VRSKRKGFENVFKPLSSFHPGPSPKGQFPESCPARFGYTYKSLKKILKINEDGLAKSQNLAFSVIPAKAGIQEFQLLLDPGFRQTGETFCEIINKYCL
jgi:hypothetical protein